MKSPLELIFPWDGPPPASHRPLAVDDETLRDGLQSPSTRQPSLEEKKEILHLLAQLGVAAADLGMPAAGARVEEEVVALASEITQHRLPLSPNCAVRALERDVSTLARLSQQAGLALEAMLFLGFSALRREVEGWSRDHLLRKVEATVSLGRREGLPVTFVAEDASRTAPNDLAAVLLAACRAGATRVCLADTTGCLTPLGAQRLASFSRQLLDQHGFATVGLDWHGHNDRGLAGACALAAAQGGADRLHGSVLGVGERTGNAPTEQLLVNLWLMGFPVGRIENLRAAVERIAQLLGVSVPPNAPAVGHDAFRTATGVHASAILKAKEQGRWDLAEWVYAPFPPSAVGGLLEVEVGPYSGAANVRHWLWTHGWPLKPQLVRRILEVAKSRSQPLTDEELEALARQLA
ncbi:MAG: hypothetical protein N2447_00605 [Thermoanaerobaculum sp.]|nr:hypothetical protein [Thermoanaerobaculum sp.]MDW7967026.1 hypothetical protein [Thermoanaerobaculum sp.]